MHKPAKAHATKHPPTKHAFRLYVVTTVLLLLLGGLCAFGWKSEVFRPYVVGLAAGIGALLGPIPGLVTPETRGKWIIVIFISATIGYGTWFSLDALEKEKDKLQSRFEDQRQAFEVAIKDLSPTERDAFVKNSARHLKVLFDAHRYDAVLDLASIVSEAYPRNGHALYYRGETYRILRNRSEMRGSLNNYLAAAKDSPDGSDGPAASCYDRANGLCGERTAWINHLLASDFYYEALSRPKMDRESALSSAFKYEHATLELRHAGFDPDMTVKAPCDNLRHISAQFGELGEQNADLEVDLKKYCS